MEKLKSSICSVCCFRRSEVDADADVDPLTSPESPPSSPSVFQDVKGKCRTLVARAARHRRRSSPVNCSYDPLSYALNFDEGPDHDVDGGEIFPAEYRYRNFSSRFPVAQQSSATDSSKDVSCR